MKPKPCGKCAACRSHDPDLCLRPQAPKCEVCEGEPVVPETGMCGPCTFGEAETVGGNW